MKGKTTKKAEKAVKQLCLQNIDFVSNDSQRSRQTHKPFLQLFALSSSPLPLEILSSQMWGKLWTVNTANAPPSPPRRMRAAASPGSQHLPKKHSSPETPSDSLWGSWSNESPWAERIEFWCKSCPHSGEREIQHSRRVSWMILPFNLPVPTQIQTFATSCLNYCTGLVYKCSDIFSFWSLVWTWSSFSHSLPD